MRLRSSLVFVELSLAWAERRRASALSKSFWEPTAFFNSTCCAIVGLPGISHGGFVFGDGCLLQIIIEREERRADLDGRTLAHG